MRLVEIIVNIVVPAIMAGILTPLIMKWVNRALPGLFRDGKKRPKSDNRD